MSDFFEMKNKSREHEHARVKTRSGGAADRAQDKEMIKKAFAEHDAELHKGQHTKLKFKNGGKVEGEKHAHRMPRAEGGRANKKGAGKGTHVNVIVASPRGPGGPGGPPMGGMPPVPAAGMAPPRPPMPPPGAGMGPPAPGGAMGPPPGMPPRAAGGRIGRKDGGKVSGPKMETGSGGGLGRLEKIKEYGGNSKPASTGDSEEMPAVDDAAHPMKSPETGHLGLGNTHKLVGEHKRGMGEPPLRGKGKQKLAGEK